MERVRAILRSKWWKLREDAGLDGAEIAVQLMVSGKYMPKE